jgi:hypothetical protein
VGGWRSGLELARQTFGGAKSSIRFAAASASRRPHIEINAGELHRVVGGYPPGAGHTHSMPSCCNAMRAELSRGNAEIVFETKSGVAPALTVRYRLPR